MKKIPVEQALGMTLCHDITAMRQGFKGPAFRRGHIICEQDIPVLLDLGKKSIFAWEAQAGEIHEEDAARRMAAAVPVKGARYTEPSEGKVLLIADSNGLFRVDTDLLREINSIGDLTIATLPDHYPAEPGMSLASMRIVPLVTQEKQVLRAEALCREKNLLALKPYHERTVGVIITGSEVYSGRIADRFEPVLREKLGKYPCRILDITFCDDDVEMIRQAARRQLEAGADFLILTGGMSVDPDDLTPTAIAGLGARVLSHGVPAQPGNMTLVAYLKGIPILGVPGAAIHLPTTVFDVLLPPVFAGEAIRREDLIRLGEGGLCQLCPQCHFPNCTFGRY
jgi:molybdenum cofactor synthesis domain-containing protein